MDRNTIKTIVRRWLTMLIAFLPFISFISHANSDIKEIVFIPKSSDQVFWDLMRSGVNEELAKHDDIHLIWRGPAYNDDTDAQIQILKFYTSEKTDAIIIAPTDKLKLVQPINDAAKLGIKIIIVDSDYAGEQNEAFISTDNYISGQKAAVRMAKILNNKGNVLVVRIVSGSASTDRRAAGFIDKIKSDYPDIHIKDDLNAGGSRGKILHYISDYLIKERINNTTIDGIFSVNESATDGVLRSLSNLNMSGKIKLIGFDYTDYFRQEMLKGNLDSLIIQDPKNMGKISVKIAINAVNGIEEKDKNIYTESIFMTKENMNSEEILKIISL